MPSQPAQNVQYPHGGGRPEHGADLCGGASGAVSTHHAVVHGVGSGKRGGRGFGSALGSASVLPISYTYILLMGAEG
ncbi:MAG: hypothetical protein U0401_25205 [Anaerolineae bacterium]